MGEEELRVKKGLNFGLDKLDSICQEMAENENQQLTPEEIEKQNQEISFMWTIITFINPLNISP